jgi:hypothetical protein
MPPYIFSGAPSPYGVMRHSEHFAAEQWADFVRNVAADEQARQMQGHLASLCQSCTEAHALWSSVREAAAADRAIEVPESSVRVVKAMFAIQRPTSRLAQAFEAVSVLFDSDLAPAAAGVRSGWTGRGRKVLYNMGDFLVDLQIEPSRDRRRTLVIGQVLCGKGSAASVDRVPVILLRDLAVIGKSLTNQSGEFQMEFDGPSGNMSVALGLQEEGTALSLGSSVGHS